MNSYMLKEIEWDSKRKFLPKTMLVKLDGDQESQIREVARRRMGFEIIDCKIEAVNTECA